MEDKNFEKIKEILKKEDCTSDVYWALFFILIMSASDCGDKDRISEENKMKEDIDQVNEKM